ncbi:hypothetical protein BU16DRAFT_568438 [Lophium mytilinum]|uniref:Uncharacterized protein n=1 Tax=Lophium mytilinum TaxID=390894 RepID=A0A6A6Q8E6_9PEZI|nr:hypothetical protein BU16DRAFT_568438 [Lophium mytilinum]
MVLLASDRRILVMEGMRFVEQRWTANDQIRNKRLIKLTNGSRWPAQRAEGRPSASRSGLPGRRLPILSKRISSSKIFLDLMTQNHGKTQKKDQTQEITRETHPKHQTEGRTEMHICLDDSSAKREPCPKSPKQQTAADRSCDRRMLHAILHYNQRELVS